MTPMFMEELTDYLLQEYPIWTILAVFTTTLFALTMLVKGTKKER
jgi:hypothetical protein